MFGGAQAAGYDKVPSGGRRTARRPDIGRFFGGRDHPREKQRAVGGEAGDGLNAGGRRLLMIADKTDMADLQPVLDMVVAGIRPLPGQQQGQQERDYPSREGWLHVAMIS